MNDQNSNQKLNKSTIICKTPILQKQLKHQKREEAKQQCPFLCSETENGNSKQFISKVESNLLRDSILQLNKPRINRPPWEIIENQISNTTENNKEISSKNSEEDSSKTETIFNNIRSSNSSTSGCSSNPQSGSCSPIAFSNGNFTTKTKNFNFLNENSFENGCKKQENEIKNVQEILEKQMKIQEPKSTNEWTLEADNASTKIISASLIQNVLLKNGVNIKQNQKLPQSSPIIENTSSASSTYSTVFLTSSNSSSPIYSKNCPLRRKEFSTSRRQILQNQKDEEEQQRILQKAKEAMRWQQKRAVDTVEEVRELGKAALQQMAILEELEFEDLERKTKISDRFSSNKFSPISSTSSGSSFECYKNIIKSPLCPTITSNISSVQKSLSQTIKTANVTNNSTIVEINGKINEKIQNNYSPTQKNKLKENKQEYHLHSHQQNEGESSSPKQLFSKQKKKLPAPIPDKNKNLFQIGSNIKKIPDSSQNSLKSLATSIIRYDDEKKEKEEKNQKINSPEHLFSAQSASNLLECRTCGKSITNVVSLGASFHPSCFRCKKCSRCLDGIPFTVEQNGEGVICMDDYERHFITHCNSCKKPINAVNEFGKIVRIVVDDREYHIQCYCCEGCGMQLSNEEQNCCFPIGNHLLCRRCHTLWRRMGAFETEAAVSDL